MNDITFNVATSRLDTVRRVIADEYAENHNKPWIIGFSGGKDSTLVAHLVIEHILDIPKSKRSRNIHVVSNDTCVESPLVLNHMLAVQNEIKSAAMAFNLPVTVTTTRPAPDNTFWVNLIGRGYPSPNRSFRWCTDRTKIQPTSQYIKSQIDSAGEVILLLGVRRDESSARAGSVARYDNGQRLHKHNDLAGCWVFRPIVDLTTDEVWRFLADNQPPWGGSHDKIIKLYYEAGGGECPLVTSKDDVPSCGTNSSRFGCWTCTVVKKDKSLSGFVESGFTEFSHLIDFRDWLLEIRNDPTRRLARRRGGKITFAQNGTHIPGPFTLATRNEILQNLLDLQEKFGSQLITEDEVMRIHSLWAEDISNAPTKR